MHSITINWSEREGDRMDNMINEKYPSLDSGIINRNQNNTISMEEAVEDVTPFAWTDEVLKGKKRVTVY